MRKSNYKQLILFFFLSFFLSRQSLAQDEARDSERDPERFLRECDCNRMKEYVEMLAREKYGCVFSPGDDMNAWLCWTFITDMDCLRKIEIFNLETPENFDKLMNYPDSLRKEFLSDGGFDSVSGICSRSDVTEEQKEYCVNNDKWETCCLGGLKYFCDEEEVTVGTDPIHIFLHGLCGVLWVLFIGYAVLSGW